MRVGQTSFIVFISKLLASALGFLATLIFARLLGAEVIGYYSIVLAVVGWVNLGGNLGISSAISKRISEAEDTDRYYTAGFVTIAGFAVAIALLVTILQEWINDYVGVDVWVYMIPLVFSGLFLSTITAALTGERKVHLSGLLTPLNLTVTSVIQIGLVVVGMGLSGMLTGYIAGEIVVAAVGLTLVSSSFRMPRGEHFASLYDFAKYSWLGNFKLRSFNDADILILGALVSSSLVGVYAVAWSLAKFLTLFGGAVRNAVFPEISFSDASGDHDRISELTEDSLSFIGLIAIPGLFGGIVIGDRLLAIYGQEFTQGATVLGVLILATLIYSFQQQMVGIIKGVDRPEVAFRINAVFIAANVVLNVALILWIGWLGAAIATATSAFIGLVLAYRSLNRIIEFQTPVREPAFQLLAAAVMAVAVYSLRWTLESTYGISHNAFLVVVLVGFGAGIYFSLLAILSSRFRTLLIANAPQSAPL